MLAKPSGEIQEPFGVTEDEVGAAITRLESLAFVGITEDFADSVRRFDARFGTSLSGTERMDNTGIFPRDGVDDVRERIEPLVQHDRALYRHARALVAGT